MAVDKPWFLALAALVVPYLFFSIRSFVRSDKWLFGFSGERKSRKAFALSTLFYCLAVVSGASALSGAKVSHVETVFSRSGIVLAIGIDISKSMLAEDVSFPLDAKGSFSPLNRLNRGRHFALELLSELKGERVGIFVFAGEGTEIVPFTDDYGYCRYIVKYIDDAEITEGGSSLVAGIEKGVEMLEKAPGPAAKVLLLISDGEQTSTGSDALKKAARTAAEKGVAIYAAGVGGTRGAHIPIRGADGKNVQGYYTGRDGEYLKTRMEPEPLESVCEIANGRYFPLGGENVSRELTGAVLARAKDAGAVRVRRTAWLELAPFFIGAALLFFSAGYLSERR